MPREKIVDPKSTELNLQQSEKIFEEIFEDSPVSLWVEDFSGVKNWIEEMQESGIKNFQIYLTEHPEYVYEGAGKIRILIINKATLTLFEADSKEKLLSNLEKVFTDESFNIFRAEFVALAEGEISGESEGITRTLNGAKKQVIIRWSVAPGYLETWERINLCIVDITNRKQLEAELDKNEENYYHLYIKTPAMLHSTDSEGKIINVSDTWLKKMAYTREEVLDHRFTEFLTDASQEYTASVTLPEFFKTGECSNVPCQFMTKNGEVMDVLLSATREEDTSGYVIRSLAVLTDITERKQAEEALLQTTEELDLFFDNALSLLSISNTDGYFLRVNPAWVTTLGYTAEELKAKPFLDFVHPDDVESTLNVRSALTSQKSVIDFTNRFRCKDDSYRWIEWRSFLSGNIIYAVARDITDNKRAAEEKRYLDQERQAFLEKTLQVSDLKSNLISQATHELKTPLTCISGWVELLCSAKKQGKSLDSNFNLEDLESILRNADRLNDLINEFLDMGQIESGKLELARQDVEFSEVIENAVQAVDYLAIQKGIILISEMEVSTRFLINRRRMEQVLINLLSNSIKYSPEGSHVTLTTRIMEVNDRSMFSVQVIDEGYGFTPEELAEATTPFGKAYTQQEQKRAIGGTGLGLFISRNIVEQQGGTLTIHSEGANCGTTVEVLLPIVN